MAKGMISCSRMVLSLVVLVVIASPAVKAIDCGGVILNLLPCKTFLGGFIPLPTTQCCSSAKSLAGLGGLKELCQCLKSNPPSFKIVPAKADLLSVLCNLGLNLPISPLIDCTVIPPAASSNV